MFKHAENLEFEQAGEIRDRIGKLREHAFDLPAKAG
jgi:excinuclease ABC subunit B